ncbi:MAG TPA: carboxypeptidase regulatory-like domain-containing protein, partial [Thermoplasmata archaeon]|nr:carboxypeptidase regulatory-like domain-containing protein [Thermoplasmata archaeon]
MDKKFRRLLTGGIIVVAAFVFILTLLSGLSSAEKEDVNYINGYVKDSNSHSGIGEATITILDPETGKMESLKTEENGFYNITSFDGKDIEKGHYIIHVTHPYYKSSSKIVNKTRGYKNIYLEPIDPTGLDMVTIKIRVMNLDELNEDDEPTPIKGAEVYLVDLNQSHKGKNMFGVDVNHVVKKTSDKSGWAIFSDVYNVSYRVLVSYENMFNYFLYKGNASEGGNWQGATYSKRVNLSRKENNLTLSIEVNKEIEPDVKEGIGDFKAVVIFDHFLLVEEGRDNMLLYMNKGLNDSTYHVYVKAEGFKAGYKDITAQVNDASAAGRRIVSIEFTLDPYDFGIPESNATIKFMEMNKTEVYKKEVKAFDMGTSFAHI